MTIKDKIIHLYVSEGKSAKEIAKKYSTSVKMMTELIILWGLSRKKRSKQDRPTKQMVIALLWRYGSIENVAKTFGISQGVVARWCKHHKIPYKGKRDATVEEYNTFFSNN